MSLNGCIRNEPLDGHPGIASVAVKSRNKSLRSQILMLEASPLKTIVNASGNHH